MTESATHTVAASEEPSTNGSSRQARLAAAVANLRTRQSLTQLPLERWLLIVGALMVPLGVAFILLAWYGAAHKPLIIQQFPYLISGGVLGLGLMFTGGFLYFGYWVVRLVQENRRNTEQLLAALADLGVGVPADGEAQAAGDGMLVATATGTMLHRPDCPVVVGRKGLRQLAADAPGFEPCKICEPMEAPAP